MKIIMILTNGFDPDIRVYKEAKYLVQKGNNVEILCWDRKCEYKEKKEEIIDGIEIKRFFISSQPGSGMKQLFPYIKFIKTIRRYLKNKEYKYLHCHDFDGILVGMFTKKRKEKQVVFDMHEIYTNYSYAKNKIFKIVYKNILKKSNYIVYVNNEQIKNIKEEEKLIYLPNYPEQDVYLPINKSSNKKKRINYVGSLRDYDALNTLAKIGINNENFEIGLYGTGVSYEKLRSEYKDTNIKIYGKYNGLKESGQIYRNTDILFCSYNPNIENWQNAYPVKLFEAIITLTPIIVSKGTVAGEFVSKNMIGQEVEYSNEQSIIEAIEDIIKNYKNYVENIEKISYKYNWREIAKNLDKVYKE